MLCNYPIATNSPHLNKEFVFKFYKCTYVQFTFFLYLCGRHLSKQKSKSDLTCDKNSKSQIDQLEEKVKVLELQLKKVKNERDMYIKHLKKIETDQNGYVLIETDAIKVIHQTFEKLSACFKLLKNNYFR